MKYLLPILLFFFSTYAQAADIKWEKHSEENGIEIYFSPDQIQWEGRNLVFPLRFSSEKKLPNYDGPAMSAVIVIELNCDQHVYARQLIATTSKPMLKGKTISKEKYPDLWIDLKVANTNFLEETLIYLCEEVKTKQ